MNKEITFHINNMAYTVPVDKDLEEELTKYLELGKNNDTKELLAAYIRMSKEYINFKKEVESISNKLIKY